MPTFPMITPSARSEQVIDTFGGYNHNLKINDGEFYDTRNLTTDYYPLLGNRKPRWLLPFRFDEVYGMTADADGTIYVVGKRSGNTSLFQIKDHKTITNMSANLRAMIGTSSTVNTHNSGALTDGMKQLVLFNHKLFVFPDKIAFDTRENGLTEGEHYYGYQPMDYEGIFDCTSGSVSCLSAPCLPDGSIVFGLNDYSEQAPAEPTEGTVWVDTSRPQYQFKHYNGTDWLTYTDIYTKLAFSGTGMPMAFNGLTEYDSVDISGYEPVNGTHKIVLFPNKNEMANGQSIIINTRTENVEIVNAKITVKRLAPDLDYVVAANNRLWGCRFYDLNNEYDVEKTRNEIYACALGNPFSWSLYQGLSTDSYTASCGTPGAFTGAAVINGYPVFFKENYYHKVYVSATGAHQIVSKEIEGVQNGCDNSVTIIDNLCYYKAKSGVKAFDGTQTYDLNDAFGDMVYKNASGGTAGGKYYISMQDLLGKWYMFAYDIKRGMWMHENDSHAMCFTSMSSDTFFAVKGEGYYDVCVISDYIRTDDMEDITDWEAVTGLQGYSYTGRKYITRFNLRMMLPKGSTMEVYIEYDSSGKWEKQGSIRGTGTNTFMLPVKPRRCDHFRIKLRGTGTVRIYSFSKIFEGGTDIR